MTDVTALIATKRGNGRDEWLKQAVGSLGPIPYMILENDGELAEAFNTGLREAKTEWVLIFSDDDVALPNMVDLLLMFSVDADVVYPQMRLVTEDLQHLMGVHDADPFCGNRLLTHNFVPGIALVRRGKALEVGGFRDLDYLEDWDLWVRMFRAGARFQACPAAELLYRQHPTSRNKVQQGDDHDAILQRMHREIVGEQPEVLATFYSQHTEAQTYVRCQLPARVLPGVVRGRLSGYLGDDDTVEFPEHVGAAVFSYPGDRITAALALNMKDQGVRTLVEVDDNYLINPGKSILDRSQWGLGIGDRANSRQGHRLIVRDAAGVIVTTPYLADRYRQVNPNVYVCPNGVDPADWPEVEKPDDGVLRLVWFASNSHERDIPLVTRAFEWASRQKDVQVFSAGLDPGWRFEHGRLPWMHSLAVYRRNWMHFDVSVAPILETHHGLGRSDLKVLEAAMGGCCSIVSDLAPYASWGDEVLKARDAKGFLHAVKHLVAHRGEVAERAAAIRARVLKERTNQAQRHFWLEAITDESNQRRAAGRSVDSERRGVRRPAGAAA